MTISVVEEELSSAYSPWTDAAPLVTQMPILRRADHLRRSLVPSLLVGAADERNAVEPDDRAVRDGARLSAAPGGLPDEERMLAITSGGDFVSVKGVIEAIVARLNRQAVLRLPSGADTRCLDDAAPAGCWSTASGLAFWAK